jgi:hypothetical protein
VATFKRTGGVGAFREKFMAGMANVARQVRTLRQFLDSEQRIDCNCSNYWVCSHSGPLRLELAVQRLGWDFDLYAGRGLLARHVYCSQFGHYHLTFRLGGKTSPVAGFAGSHGAGMTPLNVMEATQRQLDRAKWPEPSDWLKGDENVRKFGPGR